MKKMAMFRKKNGSLKNIWSGYKKTPSVFQKPRISRSARL